MFNLIEDFKTIINDVYYKCINLDSGKQYSSDKMGQNKNYAYIMMYTPEYISYLSEEYLYKLKYLFNYAGKLNKLYIIS